MEEGLKDNEKIIEEQVLDKAESEDTENEEEIVMEKCYYCGKELPIDELHDDGNDLTCEDCL